MIPKEITGIIHMLHGVEGDIPGYLPQSAGTPWSVMSSNAEERERQNTQGNFMLLNKYFGVVHREDIYVI